LQLAFVNICKGRVPDLTQALTNLLRLLNPAKLHVRTAKPEQRQVSDDAVRITFEKIPEGTGSLFIATLIIKVLPLGEHGLLGV
jgi:hypothetical protein